MRRIRSRRCSSDSRFRAMRDQYRPRGGGTNLYRPIVCSRADLRRRVAIIRLQVDQTADGLGAPGHAGRHDRRVDLRPQAQAAVADQPGEEGFTRRDAREPSEMVAAGVLVKMRAALIYFVKRWRSATLP